MRRDPDVEPSGRRRGRACCPAQGRQWPSRPFPARDRSRMNRSEPHEAARLAEECSQRDVPVLLRRILVALALETAQSIDQTWARVARIYYVVQISSACRNVGMRKLV